MVVLQEQKERQKQQQQQKQQEDWPGVLSWFGDLKGAVSGVWLSYLKAISERATRKRVTRIDKFVGRAICAVRRSLKGKAVGTERRRTEVVALRSRNRTPSSPLSIRMAEWTMSEIQVSSLRHLHSTSVNLLAME